jgi:alpha-L-arabinofuranosidase
MSSYLDGPWSCGSYACPKDKTCTAVQRNIAERVWLAQRTAENAWLEHYGLPTLTIGNARDGTWGCGHVRQHIPAWEPTA